MSEFKIPGDYYASQWNGDNVNAGTNPLLPKKTINGLPNSTTLTAVVGCANYLMTGNITANIRLKGDGLVVIDFAYTYNTMAVNFSTSSVAPLYSNIYFRKLNLLQHSAINGGQGHFTNCIIDAQQINTAANGNGQAMFYNCILFNSLGGSILASSVVRSVIHLYGSMLLNSWSLNTAVGNIWSTYIPKGVNWKISISYTAFATYTAAQIRGFMQDSMINGTIEFSDGVFELKKLFDGSARPDADPLILDIATIGTNWPTIYTTAKCFAGEAKIIDIFNRVVEPDSDLLKISNSYGFIGGVRSGEVLQKGNTDPDVTITPIQTDNTDPLTWVIDSPTYDEAFIDFIFKVSDAIVVVPKIHLDSLLAFDGDTAGGSGRNNNVPDYFPSLYTPLSADGLKPNRLTYKLRTSQLVTQPTTGSDWDNDSATLGTTPGDFYDQEASATPTINTAGGVRYGNADPLGFGGVGNVINGRWCHVKIRITNLREI